MRQYQIWRSDDNYAISDFGNENIDFATTKDFGLEFKPTDTLETESASKPAFIDFLTPIFTNHGIHSIFNYKGEACEQIVNIPKKIMSSDEILKYLNKYTILPQSTPPWEEIIYKLVCYSEVLTEEYFDKKRDTKFDGIEELAEFITRSEDDTDSHYFVTSPKISEEKKGTIFHLPKPNRAHRKWIILGEYYDHQRNAWVDPETGIVSKRKGSKVELIDKKTVVTEFDIKKAKKDYFDNGGTVTKLDKESESEFDWTKIEIHDLAHLIPFPSEGDRERLKEDVRLNGILEPIVLHEGKVLDGRTRQGIGVELGIKPKYKNFKADISPRAYVLAMGIHRRHLSSSQIAAIGVEELLSEFEKEAKERMLSGGVQQIEQGSNGRSCEHVASMLKTNKQYIIDAKKLKEQSPESFKKILSGELTITRAKAQLKSISPVPKKKKRSRKFENAYRDMLKYFLDNSSQQIISNVSLAARKLSLIYLKWNRKNDKKMIGELESLRNEFSDVFKEPHLKLLKRM